jgi:Rieske Fe-S protein
MTYRDDPREITARFDGNCNHPGCTVPVKKGERVFYYPKSRSVLGARCGHAEEARCRFDAERFDEDFSPNAL